MWDTAGQERFRTITSSYYRGSNAIVIVYDITNRDSFNNVRFWDKEVGRLANADVYKVLIGNKSDIEERRAVSVEEGQALARELEMEFFETSAKMDTNVSELFNNVAQKLFQKPGPLPDAQGSRPELKPSRPVGEKKSCC